jgi:hypothetical protein
MFKMLAFELKLELRFWNNQTYKSEESKKRDERTCNSILEKVFEKFEYLGPVSHL